MGSGELEPMSKTDREGKRSAGEGGKQDQLPKTETVAKGPAARPNEQGRESEMMLIASPGFARTHGA